MSQHEWMEQSPPAADMLDFAVERKREWHEVLGAELPEWYNAMWQALDAHEFGSYCHEGRSLFEDAATLLGRQNWTYEDEDIGLAQLLASELEFVCEESICEVCQQHDDEIIDNAREFTEHLEGDRE